MGDDVLNDFDEPLDEEGAEHQRRGDEEAKLFRLLQTVGLPLSSLEDAHYALFDTT